MLYQHLSYSLQINDGKAAAEIARENGHEDIAKMIDDASEQKYNKQEKPWYLLKKLR